MPPHRNSGFVQDKLLDTTQLINEATIDYTRNMNKLAFDALARRGRSELAGLALVQLVPEHFAWPAPAQVRHPAGNMFRALHALTCWLCSPLVLEPLAAIAELQQHEIHRLACRHQPGELPLFCGMTFQRHSVSSAFARC